MNRFLRYLVYGCIVFYIIGMICIVFLRMLKYILGSQGMHEGVVLKEIYTLYYIADRLRMHEMYMPNAFHRIPDHFKTQKMYDKAVKDDPWQLKDVPNHFKTQEMCNKEVRHYLLSLQFLPDWFVTQQQIDVWYDDDYAFNDNEMIKWYDSYKARKAQKAKIKKELLPIAWHPDHVLDWCMSGDEKGWWK